MCVRIPVLVWPKLLVGARVHENWEALEVYLRDGRVQIDNKLVENAIRPTAVGKKNWLFFGDANAGQRSAIVYTIIENCRRHRRMNRRLRRNRPHQNHWRQRLRCCGTAVRVQEQEQPRMMVRVWVGPPSSGEASSSGWENLFFRASATMSE